MADTDLFGFSGLKTEQLQGARIPSNDAGLEILEM